MDFIHSESIRIIKKYRTPQALRSFARLFSVFLPPFYAPYYAQMAKDLHSLGAAIAFAVLTSIALTSLFESISQIEDPFVGITPLDGINIVHDLQIEFRQKLLDWRKHFYPNAGVFKFEDYPLELPLEPEMRLFQTEN